MCEFRRIALLFLYVVAPEGVSLSIQGYQNGFSEVGCGRARNRERRDTFEHAIVRLVLQNMKGRPWAERPGCLPDLACGLPSQVFSPVDLHVEHSRGFCQDGH